MIRRMEAKISSIEGSCAFAGWLIAGTPQSSKDGYTGANQTNRATTAFYTLPAFNVGSNCAEAPL
jgi:hypothetical protein